MVAMRNVNWYRDGASLRQEEDGVSIHPNGQPIPATLFGRVDEHGAIDPHLCYVSAVDDSKSGRGFDECYLLGAGAHSFGGLEEPYGSMTCMRRSTVVDSVAKVIHGPNTDAIDYVDYGPGETPPLSGYRLSK
jgi:hypothetical protein